MGVLRSIEHRIESAVEGVFGRAFRAHVQPVELARKLAKEMDDHRTVSVSRIYVPNEYGVYLNPQDRRQFAEYESQLVVELADYLSEHARREGYALLSAPRVLVEEDADLAVGEFGIATRMVQPAAAPAARVRPEDDGAVGAAPPSTLPSEPTRIYRPDPPPAEPVSSRAAPALLVEGRRHELGAGVVVLGRSSECGIVLADANVSRQHAEVRRVGDGFVIGDLGSTNGIEVNGRRVESSPLASGDRIVLGSTEITFEQP
jgi:hypothetical protein